MGFFSQERKGDAFTLIELLVTVVIVSILVALALPIFPKAIESTKAKEALTALRQIKTAERIYRIEENDYWPVGSTETDIGIINDKLRLKLDERAERNWDYSISATAEPDTFTAEAIRTTGSYSGQTIVFNQDGLDKSSSTWTLPLPSQ